MKNFKFSLLLLLFAFAALTSCKDKDSVNPAIDALVGTYTVTDYYHDMSSFDTTSYEMTITRSGDAAVKVSNFLNSGQTVNGSIIVYKGGTVDLYQLTIPSQQVGTKFHNVDNPVINGVGNYDNMKLSLTYIVDSRTAAQQAGGTAVAIKKTQQ